jgi:ornithine cyclodeaminase
MRATELPCGHGRTTVATDLGRPSGSGVVLVLTGEDLRRALTYDDCIEVLAAVMQGVSRGEAVMPLRAFMPVPGSAGRIGWMPGAIESPRCAGIKVVAKYPTPADGSRGSHVGVVLLFDSDTGDPLAILDGAMLTSIRTAAASAVATRALARPDAARLLLVGCGEQAWHHAHAIARVRPLRSVRVWGRDYRKAGALAGALRASLNLDVAAAPDLHAAAADSDVVCTLTTSTTPVLPTDCLRPGVHVNLVGAAVRTSAEAEPDIVRASRFYTDSRASAMAQAGELLTAIESGLASPGDVLGEIGEVLAGRCAGRTGPSDVTVYKSLGIAAQDLAAGFAAYRRAQELGIGTRLHWSAPPHTAEAATAPSPSRAGAAG